MRCKRLCLRSVAYYRSLCVKMNDKGKGTSAKASFGTHYSDINSGASYSTFYGGAGNDVSSGTFYSQINGDADKKEAFTPKGTGGLALHSKKEADSSSTGTAKSVGGAGASKSHGEETHPDKGSGKESVHKERLREPIESREGKKKVCDKFEEEAPESINDSHVSHRKTVNDKVSEHKPPIDMEAQRRDKFLLYKKLPFIRRRVDFGTWVDRNKVAVSFTVISYLVALFVFAFVRINILADKEQTGVLVEFTPEPEEVKPEPEKEDPKKKKPVPDEIVDLHNAASNAAAELDGGLKDDKGTKANDIYKDAEQLNARLAASRAAYEQAQSELKAMLETPPSNNQRRGTQESERKQSRVSGNVTVEYFLENREAVYLPVPAYKCHNGGRVVVNITVNRSGYVISASVDKSSSSDDSCLCENAIEAAKNSSFSASMDAPMRQNGTITYLFLSQ